MRHSLCEVVSEKLATNRFARIMRMKKLKFVVIRAKRFAPERMRLCAPTFAGNRLALAGRPSRFGAGARPDDIPHCIGMLGGNLQQDTGPAFGQTPAFLPIPHGFHTNSQPPGTFILSKLIS